MSYSAKWQAAKAERAQRRAADPAVQRRAAEHQQRTLREQARGDEIADRQETALGRGAA